MSFSIVSGNCLLFDDIRSYQVVVSIMVWGWKSQVYIYIRSNASIQFISPGWFWKKARKTYSNWGQIIYLYLMSSTDDMIHSISRLPYQFFSVSLLACEAEIGNTVLWNWSYYHQRWSGGWKLFGWLGV